MFYDDLFVDTKKQRKREERERERERESEGEFYFLVLNEMFHSTFLLFQNMP